MLQSFETPQPADQVFLSPDGALLAAVINDHAELLAWRTASGRLVLGRPLPPSEWKRIRADREPPPTTVAFSADGSHIAITRSGAGVTVVELATGREVMTYPAYNHQQSLDATLAADGSRMLVAGGFPNGPDELAVVDRDGGVIAHRRVDAWALAAALSPDGRTVAHAKDREIQLRDAASLELIRTLQGHDRPPVSLAFSADGSKLASATTEEIRVWDPTAGVTTHVLATPTGRVALSADAGTLASASLQGGRVWDLAVGTHRVLEGQDDYVYSVAWSPDGSMIVSTGLGGEWLLWDALTGARLCDRRDFLPADAAAFTPDGTAVVQRGRAGDIIRWDVASATSVPRSAFGDADVLAVARGGSRYGSPHGHATSPDGTLLAVATERELRVLDARTGRPAAPLMTYPTTDGVPVAISHDNALIATGHDGVVRLWDVAAGRELAAMRGHTGKVYAVDFSPDDTRLASGGNDGSIRLWDVEFHDAVLELRGHANYVHSVAFSPDGTQLASGSGDGTVRIWDTVPLRDRHRQAGEAAARRQAAAPLVDRLLERLDDPAAVAEHLRRDAKLDAGERAAAQRVLLARTREAGSQRWAYHARIAEATRSISANPVAAAVHLAAAPESLRNWEWRYLSAQLDPAVGAYPSGGPVHARTAVAFRPDGTAVCAIVTGGIVSLGSVDTGQRLWSFEHAGEIFGVELAADGSRLAVIDGKPWRVRVWDTATGRLLVEQRIDGPPGNSELAVGATRIAVARPGVGVTLIATDGGGTVMTLPARDADARIHITLNAGAERLLIHTRGGVTLTDFAGHTLASGEGSDELGIRPVWRFANDATIASVGGRLFDVATMTWDQVLVGEDAVESAFSADGGTLAIVAVKDRRREVTVVDVETRAVRQRLTGDLLPWSAVALNADGTRLAVTNLAGARLWDLQRKPFTKRRQQAPPPTAAAETRCPDGTRLARVTSDGGVEILETATSRPICTLPRDAGVTVRSVRFSTDGTALEGFADDGTVLTWDTLTPLQRD